MVKFIKRLSKNVLNFLWAPSFDTEYRDYMMKSTNQLLEKHFIFKSMMYTSSAMVSCLIFILSFVGGSFLSILLQSGTFLKEFNLIMTSLDVVSRIMEIFIVVSCVLGRFIYRVSYSAELIKYILEQREKRGE